MAKTFLKFKKPGGGYEIRAVTDEEAKKLRASAGFLNKNIMDITPEEARSFVSTQQKQPLAGFTPPVGSSKPKNPLISPPHTIDDSPDDFRINRYKSLVDITPPTPITQLPQQEQKIYDEALKQQIEELKRQAAEEIEQIKQKGKMTMGATKSFLAKVGALGKTITGAPVETNLGILSYQQNLIDKAIKEKQKELEAAIAKAKTGMQTQIQERIKELNDLAQQNFENALKLIEEDRQLRAEERQQMLADLQVQKLQFDIDKQIYEINKEQVERALEDIDRMAASGIPLDQLTIDMINEYERKAGLPPGTFEAYYQAKFDEARIANEENILKVQKIKQDILNSITDLELERERNQIARRKADISAFQAQTAREKFEFEKRKYEEKKKKEEEELTEEEKQFKEDLNKQREYLAKGGSWGQAFDILKGKYPDIPNDVLDTLLNKEKYYHQTGEKNEDKKFSSSAFNEAYNYVQDLKNSGFSKDEAESVLKDAGWKKSQRKRIINMVYGD